MYAGIMRANYELEMRAPADTGIVIPTVPANCKLSTHNSAESLQDFIDELGPVLAYLHYLQEQLQECCDEIVVEI